MTTLESFLSEHLPLSLLLGYFGFGYLLYFFLSHTRRFKPDPEIAQRLKTPIVTRWMGEGFAFLMKPLLHLLVVAKITPHSLTITGALVGAMSGVLVGAGEWEWGGFFYVLSGCCDYLDGKIARATQTTSPQGAILDSLLDRFSDAFVLSGILFYYRHKALPTLLTLIALWHSFLIPYLRARGEAAGIPMTIGTLQREVRVVIIASSLLLSPITSKLLGDLSIFPHPLMGVTLLLYILLGSSTIALRLRQLLKA